MVFVVVRSTDAVRPIQGVCARDGADWPGARRRRQRHLRSADSGRTLGRGDDCRVEGRDQRGLDRPSGADRHQDSGAGGVVGTTQVLS